MIPPLLAHIRESLLKQQLAAWQRAQHLPPSYFYVVYLKGAGQKRPVEPWDEIYVRLALDVVTWRFGYPNPQGGSVLNRLLDYSGDLVQSPYDDTYLSALQLFSRGTTLKRFLDELTVIAANEPGRPKPDVGVLCSVIHDITIGEPPVVDLGEAFAAFVRSDRDAVLEALNRVP